MGVKNHCILVIREMQLISHILYTLMLTHTGT